MITLFSTLEAQIQVNQKKMEERKRWIGDELHSLVGYSEKTLVDFVYEMGEKCVNWEELNSSLISKGFPHNNKTSNFAFTLFDSLHPSFQEKTEPTESQTKLVIASSSLSSSSPSSRKHLRKKKKEEEVGGGEYDYEKDKKERDAFAERMRVKEEKSSKKKRKEGEGEKKGEEGRGKRRRGEGEGGVEREKEESRRRYLEKREKEKAELLKETLEEEEKIFKEEELTEKERRERELKKTILENYRESEKLARAEREGEYFFPDSYETLHGKIDTLKRERLLLPSFSPQLASNNNTTADFRGKEEENKWEEQQILSSNSLSSFGSKNKSSNDKNNNYQLLIEDSIQFVQSELLEGEEGESERKKVEKRGGGGGKGGGGGIEEERKKLPIFPYRKQLLEAVREHQVVIIVGETGSGKTTQITQYLHEAGYTKKGKKIGCTQPRRVAAMSVAKRVADEMGVKLGNEVGYSIRFEDCTSEKTVIKYLTDGMLLREFLGEPDLSSYSVMMIDEAHERTLHTDILFGLVKDIARFRKESNSLKLLISSATLEAKKFSAYFDNAPVFYIPGRRYPVDILYTKAPETDYLDACIVTVLQIHLTQPRGDILVFLTGQEEVETAGEVLSYKTKGLGSKLGELIITKIYSTLPSDLQAKIFEPTPPGARKVVLATNIAETSLTIPGIVYVIDPGFSKQKSYNPRTGMESLVVTPISKASAMQRAGRAGRVSPGKCFRLYTAYAYKNELEEMNIPEIQRTNLGNVVLLLKSLGIDDLINFDFMDAPPAETLIRALEQLYALGALNDKGELTKLGRRMAEFPLDPMLSKALLASQELDCSDHVVTIAAMLSVNNSIFYRPKDKKIHAENAHLNFFDEKGDHLTLLNVYQQWLLSGYSTQWCFENFIQFRSMRRARDVREQLVNLCDRVEIPLKQTPNPNDTNSLSNVVLYTKDPAESVAIRKAITSGFFYHTAKLQKNGVFKTIKHKQSVQVHPSSSLSKEPPRWVIYHELVYTSKEFMRQVIEIDPQWLTLLAPHFYSVNEVRDDARTKKLPKMLKKK